MYDPQIGRWHNCDPHSDKYLALYLYVYVAYSTLVFIDPDGKDIKPTTAFSNSKYVAFYKSLSKNNAVYAGLVSKYNNSKVYNSTLHYVDKNITPGYNAWTVTNWKASASKPNVPTSAESSEYFAHTPLTTTVEANTKVHTYERIEIGMVSTLFHEALHSFLDS